MAVALTDRFGDSWLSGTPRYLTDLDRAEPASAIRSSPEPRHWRAMSYRTDSLSGTMLAAGLETAAPTVRYPLDARGLHAISIGTMPLRTASEGLTLGMPLKLSGDATFSFLTMEPYRRPDHGVDVVEMYWKIADLTGQQLDIGQASARVGQGDGAGSFACAAARVVYIKLAPLTDAEVADWRADQARPDTRRLFAHNDAHFAHYQFGLTTPDDVRREIEPYHESDFSRMYWEAGGGDLMSYFTSIGRRHTLDGLEDYGRRGDRLHAESWRVFRDKGVDPFDVALEQTREVGMEFHACYRVAGFQYPPPLDHHNHGDTYFQRHPEFRGEDRAGNRTPRISYSYPEVREFVVSLLREMAERPIDGVCLLYNRRPPVVEYEPPLVDGFTREFGRDPRTLPEGDRDWLTYRAGTLTQFMRDVRAAMDEASRDRPRRIAVSAIVAASETENLMQGLDLAAWVREGLVDTLIPYSARANFRPFFNEPSGAVWTDAKQLDFLVQTVAGSPCVVAPNVMPRSMPPEDYRRQAAAIYAAGAEHLFFWDSAGGGCRANFGHEWNALRRLGHVDEVQAWIEAGEPELPRSSMPLREWAGWDLSYVTPG